MSTGPGAGPVPGAASGPGAPGRARRGRWVVLLLAAAGLVGLVSLPSWVVAEGRSALEGTVSVAATGSQVAPGVPAAALVLLASAAAVALVGRVGRWVVAAVVVGAGALVVSAGVTTLGDPAAAVAGVLADATGVATGDAGATVTPWPAVTVALGVVVVLVGGGLARAAGGWEQRSRRHERPQAADAAPAGGGPADERADWDALTRGDDPS